MALGANWRAVGVVDCKIYLMTTDTSGTLVYASAIDVPDVKEIKFKIVGKASQSMGDAKATALEYITTHGNGSFSSDMVPRAVVAALTGASVVDTLDAGGSNVQTIRAKPSNAYPYFKIEAQVARAQGDVNDLHLVLGKCKLSAAPEIGGFKGADGFMSAAFSFDFIEPTSASAYFYDLVGYQVAATIT